MSECNIENNELKTKVNLYRILKSMKKEQHLFIIIIFIPTQLTQTLQAKYIKNLQFYRYLSSNFRD